MPAPAMFKDPRQSGVVIVALPEDMPANESIELAEAVRGELRLPIAKVIVNQVVDLLFGRDVQAGLPHREVAARDQRGPGDDGVAGRAGTAGFQ